MKPARNARFPLFLGFLLPFLAGPGTPLSAVAATDADGTETGLLAVWDVASAPGTAAILAEHRDRLSGIVLEWDGNDPAAVESALETLETHGLPLYAVTGPVEPWIDYLAGRNPAPRFWLPILEDRGGLQYQKVRATGRNMLGAIRALREAGLACSVLSHGDGWTGEWHTLVDVGNWLQDFAGLQDIGLVYRLHAGQAPASLVPDIIGLGPRLDCVILPGPADATAAAAASEPLESAGFTGRVAFALD